MKKNKTDINVSNIEVNMEVNRFDQIFYSSPVGELPTIKRKYPYLFPTQYHDSIWVQKMQDKDEQELFAQAQKQFSSFEEEKLQLSELFKHIKYYYPDFKAPKVVTLLTNVDYENKVVYADSLLFISLDLYLGADNQIYQDFPGYIKNNFSKAHLVVDVATAIANVQIPNLQDRSFVSRMIQEGKKKYLLDAYLPNVSDALKMGYTQDQINWAEFNDQDVWKYFVQNKLLFSTDQELTRRFIDDAPFSKFYQANDSETPGKIGVWFGWQIVRAYMKNNNTTLQDLLKIDNEDIFKKSKFKPTK